MFLNNSKLKLAIIFYDHHSSILMSKEQNVQVFQSVALTRRLLNEDAMKTKA